MWRGATLFWGILFVYSLIRGGIEYSQGKPGYLSGLIKSFIGGAVSVSLVCLLNTWGSSPGFSFSIISWFHVCILVLFALLLAILGTVHSTSELIKRVAIIAFILSASLLLPFIRSLSNELLSGLNFLSGSDSWLDSIGEQQSLFHWGFSGFLKSVTLLWFAIPVAGMFALRDWLKGGCTDHKLLALMVWGGGMLPLLRLRYAVVLAIPVALSVAYLFEKVWNIWPLVWQRIITCGTVLLFLAPTAQEYFAMLTFDNSPVVTVCENGKNSVFEWLRRNTPPTSYYDNPTKAPEYGILSSWGLGSKIYYLAHRPAVATAFGWEAHGLYEIAGFLATGNPGIAYEIARRNRVRYVLLRDEDYGFEFRIAKDGVTKGKLPAGTVNDPDPAGSMYQRLKYFEGSSHGSRTRFIPALNNYRLLNESSMQFDTPTRKVSHYKIFEVVPGAVVKGQCMPGDFVSIELPLITSTGRTLPFSDKKNADDNGKFEFRVPYSTGLRQGDTVPKGKYKVNCRGVEKYSFDVHENAVTEGETISLAR
jgi:dolichyl-diphosphooligosaccharide--protein glycosyltransferase